MKTEDLLVGGIYNYNYLDGVGKIRYKNYEFDGFGQTLKYTFIRESGAGKGNELALTYWQVEESVGNTFYTGEKTMTLTRKPEEIRVRLSKEGLTDLLSSQGYDLADYELDKDIYNENGFVFEFKLKQEVDNG